MEIGILSDIHGDQHALDRVLDRLDNHHRVDYILCAGDLVGRGPHPDTVVETIRKRQIPTVRGNHDEWFIELRDENIKYLRGLPLEWRGTLEETSIYMCHGKPGNNLWGLYRDHISDTLLNMMLESLGADVLITGHTHVPLFVRVQRGCVINPGSMYTFKSARATSHTYGVLRVPDLSFDLYDVNAPTIEPLPQLNKV